MPRRLPLSLLAGGVIFNLLVSATSQTPYTNPQYLCLNKMYGCTTQPGCWNEGVPSSLSQASIDLFFAAVGGERGSNLRRLCLGFQIDTLSGITAATQSETLANLLALSSANDLPVVITLDAFEFWNGRPDLWNWWNSSLPGYNPANANNVEWTDWSAENATKIAWANWGSQFRKPPHPNLASPVFRAAVAEAVRPLAAQVAAWYRALPPGRQYLLAGVKAGWELWIGTNFFYYSDGNKYVNAPVSEDPTTGIVDSAQLGYAAACSMGLACTGNLTVSLLDAVLADFLSFSTGILAPYIPRNKILTHEGNWPFASGNAPNNSVVYNSPAPAVTPNGAPGWSFYHAAYNVSTGAGLAPALDLLNGTHWAASEFGYMGGNHGSEEAQWEAAFTNALGYANNRLVDVYNLEDIDAAALSAAKAVLNVTPACLVDSPGNLSSQATGDGDTTQLRWTPGQAADDSLLLASTSALSLVSGFLAVPDVLAVRVPPTLSEYALNVSAWLGVPLYWQVVARGCMGSQQMPSDIQGVSGSGLTSKAP